VRQPRVHEDTQLVDDDYSTLKLCLHIAGIEASTEASPKTPQAFLTNKDYQPCPSADLCMSAAAALWKEKASQFSIVMPPDRRAAVRSYDMGEGIFGARAAS
jgi:hypothetical protein